MLALSLATLWAAAPARAQTEGVAYTLSLPGKVAATTPKAGSKKGSAKAAASPPAEGEFLVSLRGLVRFNEREDGLASLGGVFTIDEVIGGRRHHIEFRSDDENVVQHYRIDGREMPVDAQARAWLARAIPLFLRESGWNARERSLALLTRGGPDALLAEAEKIRAGLSRSLYLRELAQYGPLDRTQRDRAVAMTASLPGDIARRDVMVALLQRQQLDVAELITVLAGVTAMRGEFEKRAVLDALAPRLQEDAALLQAWKAALASMQVEGELRRALLAPLRLEAPPPALLAAVLEVAQRLRSPFERRSVLESYAPLVARQPALVAGFAASARAIATPADRRAVLVALARSGRLDVAGCHEVLAATDDLPPGADLREVLLTLAAHMPNQRELLLAYLQRARRLADADRQRAEEAVARFGS